MITTSSKITKSRIIWKLTTAALALYVMSGCVTGKDKPIAKKDIFDTNSERVVVQRIDTKEPIVSPFSKNHWMDARRTKVASIKRIHGLLATGESLAAERDARKFLMVNPDNVEGLTALASALAQSGQYDLAAYYAKLVATKLPNNPHSLNIQGLSILISATKIEDFRQAETLFQRAFDGSESEVAAGLNLGDLYLELGNSDSALKIFATTRSRCKDCIPALMGFGIASRRLGNYSEALDAFNIVSRSNKANVDALYHIALVYRDGLKNRSKAEDVLRQLIATTGGNNSVKERAQTVLRSMLTETDPGKTAVAAGNGNDFDDLSRDLEKPEGTKVQAKGAEEKQGAAAIPADYEKESDDGQF
jgi:tetratricopeptide (TPR) repeat protein